MPKASDLEDALPEGSTLGNAMASDEGIARRFMIVDRRKGSA